jgi:molybdenum cofactor cytidylyltransferase
MRFGRVPIAQALGGVVAHAVRHGDLVLKKGVRIGPEEIEKLEEAGVSSIFVAVLEAADVDEQSAAERLAVAACGPHVRRDPPFTGRVNLFAETAGVLLVDAARIDAANAVDDAITIATLPAMKRVEPGEMVGTVKIIPFAVAEPALLEAARHAAGAVAVAPFRAKRLSVISTELPGLKRSVIEKTIEVLRRRIEPAVAAGAALIGHTITPHDEAPLAQALAAAARVSDIVVVFGASAITDVRDVIPAAIESAGGRIEHFGMPVDPGNLLLLGSIGGSVVIGAPGCARSPKENGFDWVLDRCLAEVPVTKADIRRMGVGGLLMEIVSRPQPRMPEAPPPRIGAVVLAAGLSSRMGGNKLLVEWRGKPMLRHAVEAALAAAGVDPVVVVTGHEAGPVAATLDGLDVTIAYNPAYRDGLASSLKAGVAALPREVDAAVVMLGDMPLVDRVVVERLIAAFAADRSALAVAPVAAGRRANPVLIAREGFADVATLEGDEGARGLFRAWGARVIEAPLDIDAVLMDVDTPDALAALRRVQLNQNA